MAADDPACRRFRLHAAPFHQPLIAFGERADDLLVGLRIDDLDLLVEVQPQAQLPGLFDDDVAAADQRGMGQAFIHHRLHRAQHAFFLGLGIDHAGRALAGDFEHRAHQLAGAVDEFFQLVLVGVEVFNGAAGHAGFHGGARHGGCDRQDQSRVEWFGNDVFGAKARRMTAVSSSHHIAGFGTGECGDGFHRRDLHRLVDGGGIDIQRPAEHEREAQNIVDLVGIVRTAGGDDGVGTRGLGQFRQDFRIGIGQRQDQGLFRHLRQPFGLEHIGGGKPQEHVRAHQHIAQRAGVGLAGEARHIGRHLVAAILVHHALDVGQGDIVDG